MMRTTFFTSANRAYEPFVLPYITSVLLSNEDARVEICLERPPQFETGNADALDILSRHFGNRVDIRRGVFSGTVANNVRFIETPNSQRSEEHTSELQSLMRISYAVFCLNKQTQTPT